MWLLSLIAWNSAMKVETVLRQPINPNCRPVATVSQLLLFTAFFTVASAAITQHAETLAIKVPKGTHFNNLARPNPRPLRGAKDHLIQTPKGATMQASQSSASLPPLSNFLFSNTTLTPYNKPTMDNNTTMTTM